MTAPTLLTAATVADFLREVPGLDGVVDAGDVVDVREVGDGNLNLVFVVRDGRGRSVVVKQSLPHVRTDPSWPMTQERTLREARALAAHGAADPDHVPRLHAVVPERYALVMEDLSDHRVWRHELLAGRFVPGVAAELGRHVARVGFATSVHGLHPHEHKRRLAASVNPELGEITEDLVFTEPLVDHEHNAVLPGNRADLDALRHDAAFVAEVGAAKTAFMTRLESMLHGDLHTGSVFVRGEGTLSVRAFDSEFGAYGPLAFDLGMLWGNLLLASAAAQARGDAALARALADEPPALLAAFEAEYRALWPTRRDPRVWGDAELERYVGEVLRDAPVFAAAEVVRRLVGFAKVVDVEQLPEPAREQAVRALLRGARHLALARHEQDASALQRTVVAGWLDPAAAVSA